MYPYNFLPVGLIDVFLYSTLCKSQGIPYQVRAKTLIIDMSMNMLIKYKSYQVSINTIYSVCVCFLPIHSFWTSSSLDAPAGVTQEEGHTGFLIHLLSAVRAFIFLARRIQPFLSLVDREVEFCVLTT